MSNAIFPGLPGLKIEIGKSPAFVTKIQTATSGREARASFSSAPKWKFRLQFEFMRDGMIGGEWFDELNTLMGFYLQRRGSFDSFLYLDQDDYFCKNQLIGVGDGITRSFQLTRTLGGFTEPVANVGDLVIEPTMWSGDVSDLMWTRDDGLMWLSGVTNAAYVLSPTGLITFVDAPAAGLPVYWSGTYYYRARFMDDSLTFDQFMRRFWEVKTLEFMASLGTKI